MAAPSGCSSSAPSLPPPRPKSPPEYPDLYGRRRAAAKVQMLEREISSLEDELKSLDSLHPASRCCKEVADFVAATSDPFIPTTQKTHKSCRFWKWLCGIFRFNLSWVCCCCYALCPLEMPCSCRCNPCGSCKPSCGSCNPRGSCNQCGSCGLCKSCFRCSIPNLKCCSCPSSNCCSCENIMSCCCCWYNIVSVPSCTCSCSCSCPSNSCGRWKCWGPKLKCPSSLCCFRCFKCKGNCCSCNCNCRSCNPCCYLCS